MIKTSFLVACKHEICIYFIVIPCGVDVSCISETFPYVVVSINVGDVSEVESDAIVVVTEFEVSKMIEIVTLSIN